MEHLKTLTSQQLVMAACAATTTAAVMLSHDSKLGFVVLAIAVVCGLGAFAKSRHR